MQHNLVYAGIGSRKTPMSVCKQMTLIAQQLAPTGWLLRSGGADGADLAFEKGAVNKEIHLPWDGYNNQRADAQHIVPLPYPELVDVAARHHPVWERLSDGVRMLMVRNASIILGQRMEKSVNMVICWTPGGRLEGGTAHGIRIANAFDIPVFNIALVEDQHKLCKFVLQFGE